MHKRSLATAENARLNQWSAEYFSICLPGLTQRLNCFCLNKKEYSIFFLVKEKKKAM